MSMTMRDRNRLFNCSALAVVILNYNGKKLLLDCLKHLELVDYQPLYTVVVDNGSIDDSVGAVQRRYPQVHLVQNAYNAGVSGGRNAGIQWVEKNLDVDFILFLDNDTKIEPCAIHEFVAAASVDPQIGLVAPKAFRNKGDCLLLSAGGMHFNPYTGVLRDVANNEADLGQYEESRDVQACPGFAFLVRMKVFHRIGLFDDVFNPYGWEDVDFSLRAAKAGFRIVYAPKAIVYHAGGRQGRGVINLYERHKAKNMFYFVRRHTNLIQWLCFLCVLPVRAIGRMLSELAKGNGGIILTWLGIRLKSD
jgi:GT2 family glycosyltransferase